MSEAAKPTRQHPIKLLSYTTRYFWLLLLPLARSLYSLSLDVNKLKAWLAGAWLDLLVLGIIFAFAWLRWACVYYSFDDSAITVTKGLIIERKSRVLYSQISTVSINQHLFYRLFGACTVKIGTEAGFMDDADISIVMTKPSADRFYQCLKDSKQKGLLYSVSPNKTRLWIFSLLFSSTLSGAVLTMALILQTSNMIDRELEARLILDTLTEAANRFGQFIPPIAAGAAIVIGVAWLISFITNIFSFWDYIMTKSRDSIYTRSGLFIKNQNIITLDKINCLELRQNLLSRLFGVSTVSVHACGFGTKSRSESSVLLPITTKKDIRGTLKEVFPKYAKPKLTLKSDHRSYIGFYIWPIIWALIPPVALFLMYHLMPSWYEVFEPAVIIAEIPAAWLAIVKTFSMFATGIGFNDGYFTMCYTRFFTFRTVICPVDRIKKVVIRQSPFQKLGGNCSVRIYTASDTKNPHYIYGLRLDRALHLFDKNGRDLYFTENPQG